MPLDLHFVQEFVPLKGVVLSIPFGLIYPSLYCNEFYSEIEVEIITNNLLVYIEKNLKWDDAKFIFYQIMSFVSNFVTQCICFCPLSSQKNSE